MLCRRPFLFAAAAVLSFAALSAQVAAQTKWDLPSAYPATNFHTENLNQFSKDVEAATAGKLKIQLHPNASLFKATEIKRAVQGGQAQAGEILLANYQNEWQIFGLDSLPFLADSYAKSFKLYQAQKPALQKRFAEQNMVLLYTVAWPTQGLYVKNKINTLADLKGVKWRAYSPATGRIAQLLGAQPVTIQAAELSQAMATGIVDSFMTSGSTGYDTKTYEHIKNYYNFQAWLPKNAVFVNKDAYDALDKPTQQALMTAAADAEVRGWKISEQKDTEYLDLLKKNGMDIITPSDAMKDDMRRVVGDVMLKEWQEKAGPEGQAIVQAYRQ